MSEHAFARKLVKKLREKGAMVWKINDNYAGGVPDLWVAGATLDLWAELKHLKNLPKRSTTVIKPELSPQQFLWIQELIERQRRAICIVNTPNGALLFEGIEEMQSGIPLSTAEARMMTFLEIVDWILTEINNGVERQATKAAADR